MKLANPQRAQAMGPATDVRDALVAALALVDTPRALNVHRTAPDQPQPWDAWPRWSTSTFTGGRLTYLAVHEYDALVCLPPSYEPDTVDAGDSLLAQVVAAVYTVGRVETAEPIRLTFDNGTSTPALRVHVVPHMNPTAATT